MNDFLIEISMAIAGALIGFAVGASVMSFANDLAPSATCNCWDAALHFNQEQQNRLIVEWNRPPTTPPE